MKKYLSLFAILAAACCFTGCMPSPFNILNGSMPVPDYSTSAVTKADMTKVTNYLWFGTNDLLISANYNNQPCITSDGTNLWLATGGKIGHYTLTGTAVTSYTYSFASGALVSGSSSTYIKGLAWSKASNLLYAAFSDFSDRIYTINPATGTSNAMLSKPKYAVSCLSVDDSGFWTGFDYEFSSIIKHDDYTIFTYGMAKTGFDGKLITYYNAGRSAVYGNVITGNYMYVAQAEPLNTSASSGWSSSSDITVKVMKINLATGAYEKSLSFPINTTASGTSILASFCGLPNGHFLFLYKVTGSADPAVLVEVAE
ncbi:MAG: hypothetical protein HZC28_20190 [Spirochaetes bacterium]|nr:hypothetical protein [Spirochaetota bacterium]